MADIERPELSPDPIIDPDKGESMVDLVRRAREGDAEATTRLVERIRPSLTRWAHGRLPQYARGPIDTADLVQESLAAAVRTLDRFDLRHESSFHAYLRQTVVNRIRDQVRHVQRREPLEASDVSDALPDPGESPLEVALQSEALDRYRDALATLPSRDRELILTRVELSLSYDEIAARCGLPTPSAARMAVTRATIRLINAMQARQP